MEPKYIEVRFGDKVYGITVSGDGKRFGVCAGGFGRVKYMPVVFSWRAGSYLPNLNKTRLTMCAEAAELFENVAVCSKLKSFVPECITVCEHVLKYGHGAR